MQTIVPTTGILGCDYTGCLYHANATDTSAELYGPISELQSAHPDGLFIVAGDFNHVKLRALSALKTV